MGITQPQCLGMGNVRFGSRLLKNLSEGTRPDFSCPLGFVAHYRHEGARQTDPKPYPDDT